MVVSRTAHEGRECSRCVMGTGDRAPIDFDDDGVCNYCRNFDLNLASLPVTMEARVAHFETIIDRIKRSGQGRTYDCILGISGGVDSSYLAYRAKQAGLRPLVVHFDNGWNSELAVENIHRTVTELGFDLRTYVINWQDFKRLQLAYLRASVIDIEVLTDHAIYGALYSLAIENQIRFILSGNNLATEGVLPYEWTFNKLDYVNIKDIYRKFGDGDISSYPFVDRRVKRRIRAAGIEVVTLLDYVPYVYTEVKRTIERELGWRDYGGKHHESIFTRFYQEYILPLKFGVDKRKAHLSSLICAGQMTRSDALAELRAEPWKESRVGRDRDYIVKKLGLELAEFEKIMDEPAREHRDFEVEGSLFNYYPALRPLRPAWRAIQRLLPADDARTPG